MAYVPNSQQDPATLERLRALRREQQRRWRANNPKYASERVAAHRRRNPERARETWRKYSRKRLYGLLEADYLALRAAQNNVCALCGKFPKSPRYKHLAVDHDHVTGKIRALLCGACNVMLGMSQESPALLRRAAEYLERHNGIQDRTDGDVGESSSGQGR